MAWSNCSYRKTVPRQDRRSVGTSGESRPRRVATRRLLRTSKCHSWGTKASSDSRRRNTDSAFEASYSLSSQATATDASRTKTLTGDGVHGAQGEYRQSTSQWVAIPHADGESGHTLIAVSSLTCSCGDHMRDRFPMPGDGMRRAHQ